MNLIKLLIIAALLCAFSVSTQAQQVKPKFKSLKIVSYRPSGVGNKQFIRILEYSEIDANGVLHSAINWFDSYSDSLTFNGMTCDTTYRLPDHIIVMLNKVFDGRKKLKDHMTTSKLGEGQHFAVPLDFVSYGTGKLSDYIIAVRPFMDKEFNNALRAIRHLPYPTSRKRGVVYRNKALEDQILAYHKMCKYAPVIEEIPPGQILDPIDN